MACLPPKTAIAHHHALPNSHTSISTLPLFFFFFSSSSPTHLHRSSLQFHPNPKSRSRRLLAASSGPPPPPESDPPFKKDPGPSTGLAATFSRFQGSVQIFFAVLFWLSLFFWASVWDGRDNGRPNKGSRFRR